MYLLAFCGLMECYKLSMNSVSIKLLEFILSGKELRIHQTFEHQTLKVFTICLKKYIYSESSLNFLL